MTQYILVLTTVASRVEGERLGQALVEERLAACVNVIFPVSSFFFWQEKLDNAQEGLLLIKSRGESFDRIKTRIKELHSYQLPEVIALPIVAGSEDYLNWVEEVCTAR